MNLSFQLNEEHTTVSSSIDVRVQRKNETLFLHGDKSMQLDAVLVNGTQVADERLTRTQRRFVRERVAGGRFYAQDCDDD